MYQTYGRLVSTSYLLIIFLTPGLSDQAGNVTKVDLSTDQNTTQQRDIGKSENFFNEILNPTFSPIREIKDMRNYVENVSGLIEDIDDKVTPVKEKGVENTTEDEAKLSREEGENQLTKVSDGSQRTIDKEEYDIQSEMDKKPGFQLEHKDIENENKITESANSQEIEDSGQRRKVDDLKMVDNNKITELDQEEEVTTVNNKNRGKHDLHEMKDEYNNDVNEATEIPKDDHSQKMDELKEIDLGDKDYLGSENGILKPRNDTLDTEVDRKEGKSHLGGSIKKFNTNTTAIEEGLMDKGMNGSLNAKEIGKDLKAEHFSNMNKTSLESLSDLKDEILKDGEFKESLNEKNILNRSAGKEMVEEQELLDKDGENSDERLLEYEEMLAISNPNGIMNYTNYTINYSNTIDLKEEKGKVGKKGVKEGNTDDSDILDTVDKAMAINGTRRTESNAPNITGQMELSEDLGMIMDEKSENGSNFNLTKEVVEVETEEDAIRSKLPSEADIKSGKQKEKEDSSGEAVDNTSKVDSRDPMKMSDTNIDAGLMNITEDLIGELPDEEPMNVTENMENDLEREEFSWSDQSAADEIDLEEVVAELSQQISWFKYVGNTTLVCADRAKQQDTLMTAIDVLHGCLLDNYQRCASEYATETGCLAPAFHEEACGNLRMGFRDPRDYLAGQQCSWTLIVPSEFMLNLTFDEFFMENSGPECYYDYMIAFDGPSTAHPSFGKFCGRRLKFNLYGTSNVMLVHAKTDNSVGKVGFRAVYQVMDPNLGRTLRNASILTASSGQFEVSSLPPTLLDSYIRSWYYTIIYIRAPYGYNISLEFEFSMAGEDYLVMHDGPIETNKAIVNITSAITARKSQRLWTTSFLACIILRKANRSSESRASVKYQTHRIQDLTNSHSPQCSGNVSIYLDPETGGHWIGLKSTAVPLKKRPIVCYWTLTAAPGYSVEINVNEYQSNGPNNDGCFHEGLVIVNEKDFRGDAEKIGPFCDSYPPGLFDGTHCVFSQYVSPGSSVIVMFYSYLTYPTSTAAHRGPFKALVKASACRGVVQLCSSPLPQYEENQIRLVPRTEEDTLHIEVYCDKAACCVLQQFPTYRPLGHRTCNVTIATEGSKLIATSVFQLNTAIPDKTDTGLQYACQVYHTQQQVAKGRVDLGYECLGTKMYLLLASYSNWVTASFSLQVSEKRCGYFHPRLHDTFNLYPPCALAEFPAIFPKTYRLHFSDPFYKNDRYFSFVFRSMGRCAQECVNDRIEFHDRHGEFVWERLPRLPFRWNSWSSSGGNWSRTFLLVRNKPECLSDSALISQHCGLEVHFKQNTVPPVSNHSMELRCPDGFSLSEHSCYKVAEARAHVSGVPYSQSDNLTYTEARHLCREAGSDLVSINNGNEMKAVHRFLFQEAWKKYLQYTPGIKVVFIGLKDSTEYKELRWVTGQPLTYMEWNNPVYNVKRPTHFRFTQPTDKLQPAVSSKIIREELNHLQPSVTKGNECVAMVIESPFEQTRWVKIPCHVKIPGAVPLCEATPINMSLPFSANQFGENVSRSYHFMSDAGLIDSVHTTKIVPTADKHLLVVAQKMCPSPFVNLGTKCIAITTNPDKQYVKTGFPAYECKRGIYNELIQEHLTNARSMSLSLRAATFIKEEVTLLKLMLPSLMQRFEAGNIRISYKSVKKTDSLDHRDCYILSPTWNSKLKKETWKMIALDYREHAFRKCDGKEPYEGLHKDLYNYICEVNPVIFRSMCEKHHYKCGDGMCILSHNFCDGKIDCLDGTDEDKCGNVCHSTVTTQPLPLDQCFSAVCHPGLCSCTDRYFQCFSGGCVPVSKVCNFYKDCMDGSDEMACSPPHCTDKQFTCSSGQCVPIHNYCDFVQNCVDGSDEDDCGFQSGCPRSIQTNIKQVNCSSDPDCNMKDTLAGQKARGKLFEKSIKHRYYTCPDQTCVPTSSEGDFIPDCPVRGQTNASLRVYSTQDEALYLVMYADHSVTTEGEPHLPPSQEVCNMSKVSCNLHVRRCFHRNESCVFDLDPRHQLVGCRDAAHLQNCAARQCGHMFKCPNSYCLPIRRVCDGFYDCENGEDEVNCDTYYCPGMFRCKNERQCIPQSEVCNGVINCHLSGEDEEMCELRKKDCPKKCQCYGHYANCSHIDPDQNFVDDVIKKLNVRTKALILRYNGLSKIPEDIAMFYKLFRLDVSHNSINSLAEIFDSLEALVELHLAYNDITTLSNPYFKKLHNLRVLNFDHNIISHLSVDCFSGLHALPVLDLRFQQLRQIQAFQFSGMRSLKHLLLGGNHIDSIHANAFSTRDGEGGTTGVTIATLEVLDLKQNPISISEKQAFELLPLTVNLTTDRHKFCCFAAHVSNCFPQADEFSSCSQMIANKVLRVVLWGIGLLASAGNLLILQQRMKHEKETTPSLLVQHLSFSDLLMGAYLLIIAGADQYFKDHYIDYTDKWRVHALCKLSGFLSMLSLQMSAFLSMLLTTDRLLACVPRCGGQGLFLRSTRGLIAIGWTLSAVVSVIPILELPYFGSDGFVRSGVCTTFNIIKGRVSGWEYSMAVFVIYNSVCYLVSGLGYIIVSVYVAQGVGIWEQYIPEEFDEDERENELMFRENERVIAKRLLLVVMTNFLLWTALISLSVLALLDYTVQPVVSAWVTLIIVPLNAAINPFLYGLSTQPYRLLDDDLLANWIGETEEELAEGDEDKANTEVGDSSLASSQSFRKGQEVEKDEESKAKVTAQAREAVIKELL